MQHSDHVPPVPILTVSAVSLAVSILFGLLQSVKPPLSVHRSMQIKSAMHGTLAKAISINCQSFIHSVTDCSCIYCSDAINRIAINNYFNTVHAISNVQTNRALEINPSGVHLTTKCSIIIISSAVQA